MQGDVIILEKRIKKKWHQFFKKDIVYYVLCVEDKLGYPCEITSENISLYNISFNKEKLEEFIDEKITTYGVEREFIHVIFFEPIGNDLAIKMDIVKREYSYDKDLSAKYGRICTHKELCFKNEGERDLTPKYSYVFDKITEKLEE